MAVTRMTCQRIAHVKTFTYPVLVVESIGTLQEGGKFHVEYIVAE